MAGVVCGLLLLLLAVMVHRKQAFRPWSMRTLWYGAERNFVTVFSLIHFIAMGDPGSVTIAYLMIGMGDALSKAAEPLFRKRIPSAFYEWFCMAAACIASCLMLVPFKACYMAGTLLTVLFVSMGNAVSLKAYLADARFPAEERRLVRARFYGLGAVLEQALMLIVLFAASSVASGDGSAALAGYTFQTGSAENGPAFFVALAVCIVVSMLSALYCAGRKSPSDGEKT